MARMAMRMGGLGLGSSAAAVAAAAPPGRAAAAAGRKKASAQVVDLSDRWAEMGWLGRAGRQQSLVHTKGI